MFFKLFLGLLLFCFSFKITFSHETSSAFAKEGANVTQTINIYDAVVVFPLPSWYEADAKKLDNSKYSKQQKGSSFLLEQIQKNESFKSWTSLYALAGLYAPNNPKFKMMHYIDMTVRPFINACGKENFALQKVSKDPKSHIYIMLCKSSPHAPLGSGYGKDVGEVGIFYFNKVKDTYIKVYQEWRGPSFHSFHIKDWPTSKKDVLLMIERFKSIKSFAGKR